MRIFDSKTDIARSLLWFILGAGASLGVFTAYGLDAVQSVVERQVAVQTESIKSQFSEALIDLEFRLIDAAAEVKDTVILDGAIVAFAGRQECPQGWERFDAAQDRFLLGGGEEFTIGTGGGTAYNRLTIENMPNQLMIDVQVEPIIQVYSANGTRQSRVVANVVPIRSRSSQPVNNLPPYTVVLFCTRS